MTKPFICPDCGKFLIITDKNLRSDQKFYNCKCVKHGWYSWLKEEDCWYKWTSKWEKREKDLPHKIKVIFDPSYKSGEKELIP